MKYNKHYSKKQTPQSQKADEGQVKNNAGGYSFAVTPWTSLNRFLILGTEGGTYYIGENKLTVDNCKNVVNCIKEDGIRVVNEIVRVSDEGLAAKNDSAIFALALAASAESLQTRSYALANLNKVCRTGTHLFQFVDFVTSQRGWGRALRKAVANWYLDKTNDSLAYQVIKYQQRGGWSQRDVLRVSHPKTKDEAKKAIFQWVTKGTVVSGLPDQIKAVEEIKGFDGKNIKDVNAIVSQYNLPFEAVPTVYHSEASFWETLIPSMGIMALYRNLGRFSKLGLLKELSATEKLVISRLTDEENLKKGRVHPYNLFVALNTYRKGHGYRGSQSWNVNQRIVAALEDAFQKSFKYAEKTGKNYYYAVDVSGSMSCRDDNGITCEQGARALAYIGAKTEDNVIVKGFSSHLVEIAINKNTSLQDILKLHMNFGRTDCAQPMIDALNNKLDIDTFVVLTDNETWHGRIHPHQALEEYRRKMNKPNAKLIVVGMAANNFSIANPNDPNMLDVCGFDASLPKIIATFSKE